MKACNRGERNHTLPSRENNFRAIRHIAAASVIFSHAFVVTGGYTALGLEPLEAATGISFAEIAVDIFFITSGYLVTQSLLSRHSLIAFFVARAVRIYPALIVVACFTALLLGPLLTGEPFETYFRHKSVYAYALYNSTSLTPYRFQYILPGVFQSNPIPTVNASLWTLPWEIWMYSSLGLLFAFGFLRRFFVIPWIALLALHTIRSFGIADFSDTINHGIRLAAYFYTGAIFFRYRQLCSYTPVGLLVGMGTFTMITLMIRNDALLPLFLTYGVLFLALYQPIVVGRLTEGGDISYGIYLYAFPVQQILVLGLTVGHPYLNAAASLVLTVPIAILSWHIIERPVLDRKEFLISEVEKLASRLRSWG